MERSPRGGGAEPASTGGRGRAEPASTRGRGRAGVDRRDGGAGIERGPGEPASSGVRGGGGAGITTGPWTEVHVWTLALSAGGTRRERPLLVREVRAIPT